MNASDHIEREDRGVDPRAAIMLRMACRYDLLRAGAMSLDEALDDQFIADFLDAVGACWCRHVVDHFDRVHHEDREQRLRKWRGRP